jgi:hypothetical protein
MADQDWTVKEMIEALTESPPDAKALLQNIQTLGVQRALGGVEPMHSTIRAVALSLIEARNRRAYAVPIS